MLSYNEALKVWAADRFGLPLDLIASVELEEVPAEEGYRYSEYTADPDTPSHIVVTVWPDWDKPDPRDLRGGWEFKHDLSGVPLAEIIYGVLVAGLGAS